MIPAEHELQVYQGAYFAQRLEWKDANDDPIDLTGYTARMQVRRRIEAAQPLVTLTTDNGRITLGEADPTDGVILLELSAADTAGLPATPFDKSWFYDLELVPAGGQVRRLMMGRFRVSPEVTR